jgi:hypothetical protein
MKEIVDTVYQNLAPDSRLVAVIEAIARGDERERERLTSSCPRVTCHQRDPRFTEKMDRLMGLALAIEADLKECALRFFVTLRLDPENSTEHLQAFANILDAWQRTLRKIGIDAQAMASAGPPTSPVFELLQDLIPEPELEQSEALCSEILRCLRTGDR